MNINVDGRQVTVVRAAPKKYDIYVNGIFAKTLTKTSTNMYDKVYGLKIAAEHTVRLLSMKGAI